MAAADATYLDSAQVMRAAVQLADANPACRISQIASSREGREVIMLTLAADQGKSAEKPAILITAGLDGRHRVGTSTALGVARLLLSDHAALLNDVTIYIVPCANPDGLEANLGAVNLGHVGNRRPVDDDRDGAVDENGPSDLNGDGMITQMRRIDPPLDDPPTHLADPAEPRLLKKPDGTNGERAIYTIYTEGLDSDGDGLIAEDGVGFVDLDRNFMHRWPEHEQGAGSVQISEPESAALAKFVLEHRNIVLAITYGRHDNLINIPDAKAKDITGEAPREMDGDDLGWHKEISKKFKDITGQERAAAADSAGAFFAWLYAQRGLPSVTTQVWGRPEASKPKDEPKDEKKDGDAASQPASAPASQPEAENGDNAKPQADDEKSPRKEGKKKDEPTPADEEAAAWLKYSDRDREGKGFVDWKPFDHPTLGKVEIGGFAPGFQMNPPEDQLAELAEKQTAFVVELIAQRPKLSIEGPDVMKLASGLYEIRLAVVNDGFLPTTTSMARKAQSVMPTLVKLDVPVERIVTVDRVSRARGIDGSGGRASFHWIVRADDGSSIKIELTSPQLGHQVITAKAAGKR